MPHKVEWTSEKVARFWDEKSQLPSSRQQYFSRLNGQSILRHLVREHIPIEGRILDFGCGPGYFMKCLLDKGLVCEGLDFSVQSVAEARSKLEVNSNFNGCVHSKAIPTPLTRNTYDLIFFIETIEHLLDSDLGPTLQELSDLLSPRGLVVVTTPNEENLDTAQSICPDCGALFHPMQHQRSWNRQSLASQMERIGFSTLICRPVYFSRETWQSRLKAMAFKALGYQLPHLLYVGLKPNQDSS